MSKPTDESLWIKDYEYYDINYIDWRWVVVSEKYVVEKVLKALPELEEVFVRRVLERDSDGVYCSFEVEDWILYFKNGDCYL